MDRKQESARREGSIEERGRRGAGVGKRRPGRPHRFSEDERFAVVLGWLDSGEGAKRFGRRFGISESTLYRWRDELIGRRRRGG